MREVIIFGMPYTILATAEETGGKYGLVKAVASREENSPHIHSLEDEAFYVLGGELEFRIGDQRMPGYPGTYIHAPKGVAHTFRGLSEESAELLILVSPGGFEGFFSEIDGLTDAKKARTIALRYGLSYLDSEIK